MKDPQSQIYRSKTVLNAWRQVLREANMMKATCTDQVLLSGLAEVVDVIHQRIDDYRPSRPVRSTEKMRLRAAVELNGLPSEDNARHNALMTGADNA